MHKKIMIMLFGIILIVYPFCTFLFMPKERKPFSENENRYLETFPVLSVQNIKDKSFMNGFDRWFSDRFVGREQSIVVKNKIDRALGKEEFNGVFVEKDQMIEKWSGADETQTLKSIQAMNSFAKKKKESKVYFLMAPTVQEIYPDKIPANADVKSEADYIDSVYKQLNEINTINVCEELKKHKEEYLYYRTDHHWTTNGAFVAYQKVEAEMGLGDSDSEEYQSEIISNDFRGTLYSKTLDSSVTPDQILRYQKKKQHSKIEMTVYEGTKSKTYDSLYMESYLSQKDKYSVFLGLNEPLITVKNENAKKDRSLLLIKDSYANCMVPFLSDEYKTITIVDLRYYNDIKALNDNNYDDILFLYNAITFSEDTNLVKLLTP